MATPTAASPRGVRSGLCCFFFRFLAQKPVETFCDWLIYFIFFYPGGLGFQLTTAHHHRTDCAVRRWRVFFMVGFL